MANVEIPDWLKRLPLAPEFHPTDTEFADPIAYISKIEKEASAFGICKIIPPLPRPSKKYVLSNLNKSLMKCPELGSNVNSSNVIGSGDGGNNGENRAVFTTRHQELGQSVKRTKGAAAHSQQPSAHKQVWQSGEVYTLEQFESKAKTFARSTLCMVKEVSPLVIEAMFWKAASEKPICIEYANDVPGSGFGEQEGSLRYFHRRRRKRAFYQRNIETSPCKRSETDSVGNCDRNEDKVNSAKNDLATCSETPTSSATKLTDDASRASGRRSVTSSNDLEGTAGWKLSNSPWNLQEIARAPGSLTRFMPDDIPGVTSPMVYIGMLFSWFAWHVEDHELHSMNFLHTGSPKTWYSVPGECAYAFEEVIRTEAYSGNNDRLAALTLLGEKTTLLSPKVVVASSLPCCRLVQNPGEFVVTFPRAYHVGFSHGFNCGEAANFGTPQWLKVAKEAAVRRAAMDHLPMLSHQQLLYLLTMSFISRVPRSLLPGARNSRLRDRQKEERELLVKKAFIEDMLQENHILSVLGRESAYRAVLWDVDSLASPSKESLLPTVIATDDTAKKENVSHSHSETNKNQNNLLNDMSLYMENLNDLYWDDNDLSCDLQVDSGTLACVACGILGFPLMSVIQPSEKASMELLPADDILVQGRSGVSEPENTEGLSTARDLVPPENNFPRCSMNNFVKGWNTSHKFLRPRIFCLEHAVQILELLKSKGGANFLIICHSDYQKIKAHAMAVAEESGCPFKYNEIPLDNASQDDLNLIDLAIDDEVHNECGEDWTSKLGINLRYCVKVRKNSSSMQVQHALTLGGLFCDRSPNSDILSVKWKSRRLRSKIKMSEPANSKSSESIQIKKDEMLGAKLDDIIVNKEEKIIQYSRRNSKLKQSNSAEVSRNCGYLRNHPPEEVEAATCGSLDHGTALRNNSTSVSMSQMQLEIKVLEATSEMPLTSVPAQVLNSLANATQVVECVEVPTETHTVKEKVDIERGDSNSDMLYAIKVTEERKEKNYNGASPLIITSDERLDTPTEEQVMEDCNIKNEGCNLATMDYSDRGCNVENDGDTLINEFVGRFEAKMDDTVVEGSCMNSEVGGCVNLKQGIQSMDGSSSIEESSEVLRETCAAEEFSNGMSLHNVGQPDIKTENGRDQVGSLSPSSRQESFKSPSQPHNAAELCKTVIPGTEMQQEIEMLKGNNKENSVSSDITLLNQPCPTSVEEGTEVVSSKEDLSCGVILVNEVEQKIETSRDDTSQELREPESVESNVESRLPAGKGKKRKQAVEQNTENKFDSNVFIRSPCEGLRRRVGKPAISSCESDINITLEQKPETKKARKPSDISSPSNNTKEKSKGLHRCDLESCRMSFKKKSELEMHKRNRCPHEGCHKRFTSHKYAVLHQRVHDDERPLKCPWKDCSMSFKWAWARTEHLRVHTGERPYHCKIDGCGLSFRFVSDYSRHRRKTGHYVTPPPA